MLINNNPKDMLKIVIDKCKKNKHENIILKKNNEHLLRTISELRNYIREKINTDTNNYLIGGYFNDKSSDDGIPIFLRYFELNEELIEELIDLNNRSYFDIILNAFSRRNIKFNTLVCKNDYDNCLEIAQSAVLCVSNIPIVELINDKSNMILDQTLIKSDVSFNFLTYLIDDNLSSKYRQLAPSLRYIFRGLDNFDNDYSEFGTKSGLLYNLFIYYRDENNTYRHFFYGFNKWATGGAQSGNKEKLYNEFLEIWKNLGNDSIPIYVYGSGFQPISKQESIGFEIYKIYFAFMKTYSESIVIIDNNLSSEFKKISIPYYDEKNKKNVESGIKNDVDLMKPNFPSTLININNTKQLQQIWNLLQPLLRDYVNNKFNFQIDTYTYKIMAVELIYDEIGKKYYISYIDDEPIKNIKSDSAHINEIIRPLYEKIFDKLYIPLKKIMLTKLGPDQDLYNILFKVIYNEKQNGMFREVYDKWCAERFGFITCIYDGGEIKFINESREENFNIFINTLKKYGCYDFDYDEFNISNILFKLYGCNVIDDEIMAKINDMYNDDVFNDYIKNNIIEIIEHYVSNFPKIINNVDNMNNQLWFYIESMLNPLFTHLLKRNDVNYITESLKTVMEKLDECAKYKENNEELQREINHLRSEIVIYENNIASIKSEIEEKEKELIQQELTVKDMQSIYEQLATTINELKIEIKEREVYINGLMEQLAKNRETSTDLNTEISRLNSENNKYKTELDTLNTYIIDLENRIPLKEEEIRNNENIINDLRNQNDDIQYELEKCKQALDELKNTTTIDIERLIQSCGEEKNNLVQEKDAMLSSIKLEINNIMKYIKENL